MATNARATTSGPTDTRPKILALTEANLPALRHDWDSHAQYEAAWRTLREFPGRSVWLPATLEFALVGAWRHRAEIAQITELVAPRHTVEILAAAAERCKMDGVELVVYLESESIRNPGLFHRAGFETIEQVIAYELDRIPSTVAPGGTLRFLPADPEDPETLQALLDVDHASFPWLWWNSEEEFKTYAESPGVEVFLVQLRGEAVGYIGMTTYIGWGHLDRIAIVPQHQGQGFGKEALAFAVWRLAQRGARRIGLSTQLTNDRSRRLYERFGFRRSRANDYRLYGCWLRTQDYQVKDNAY